MKIFMKHHQVYLTPISPIHIGCGEDFEPTNYTIDNNVLYHFDPTKLPLSAIHRRDLLNLAHHSDLLGLQNFFFRNKALASSNAHYFVDIPNALETEWRNKINKATDIENGNQNIAKLAISRHAYSPYLASPYIPGTAFKGALATSMLEHEHKKHGSPKVAKGKYQELLEKYIKTFSNSKLKDTKFADFMPLTSIQSKVLYAKNFIKPEYKTITKKIAPNVRRECIQHGQYRSFLSETAIHGSTYISYYVKLLHDYHLPIFERELQNLIDSQQVNKEYASQVRKLVNAIDPKSSALIRLGKNGSATKVLQNGVASISIRNANISNNDEATTLWLAAESDKQTSNLLPFGWAIIEVDPQEENTALKQWCEQQPKSGFDRDAILQKRKALEAEKQRQIAEQKAKREAEIQAELEKQNMLNSLSDNQRLVMEFVEQVNSTRELQADTTGSVLLKSFTQLVESAVHSWDKSEKDFLLEHITLDLIKTKVRFNKKDSEKNLKKLLNKLTVN